MSKIGTIKEDLAYLGEDIQILTENLQTQNSLPDIDGCNRVLRALVIHKSNLETLMSMVQNRKNSLVQQVEVPRELPKNGNLRIVKDSEEMDELLTIPQVAEKLKCTRQTVYNRHIKANGLQVVYPSGSTGYRKVRRSDFEKYLAGLKSA